MIIDGFRKLVWKISSETPNFKGKLRMVNFLSRPTTPDGINITRDGVKWFIQGCDLNEFRAAVQKSHSGEIIDAINKEINKDKPTVIWDIGANIGAISLPILNKNINTVSYMFEPNAKVAGRLIGNVFLNPHLVERTKIINVALSETNGLVNFYVGNTPKNSGMSGLGHSPDRYSFPVTLQSYTGDKLISDGICESPDIIKIDVEGFEINVLKGLIMTLSNYHPKIIFEHSIFRLKEANQTNSAVTDFLRSIGYELFRLDNNKPVSADDIGQDGDFIAKLNA